MEFTKETLKEYLMALPIKSLPHASNYLTKLNKNDHIDLLLRCATEYVEFNNNFDFSNIDKAVEAWNRYTSFVRINNKNAAGKPIYSAQSKFEPTIIEECLSRMFSDYENEILKIGNAQAFSNLYFCPIDFQDFQNNSKFKINLKNQDFAIYKQIEIKIDNKHTKKVFVPIVAIECKTYLDKTMLEGSISTAEKIKNGNPYCRFCIVAETYAVDLDVDIKHSRIDQIYVLRKSKHQKNKELPPIQKEVVQLLYDDTVKHLETKWVDIEQKIINKGIVL